jgi:hypothetical protein
MTPDELAERLTVAELVEQIAFDLLEAEEVEQWQRQRRS